MFLTSLVLAMATVGQGPSDWYEPFPAHKVIGNVYYVGSKDLATFLITTPEGHILINSGFERTVPLIQKSVESLGFKMTDGGSRTAARNMTSWLSAAQMSIPGFNWSATKITPK